MKFIFEILFLGAILSIADIQAGIFAKGRTISHFWWGWLFAVLIVGAWWMEEMNYWFAGALILEHFIFFSPILNFLRTDRKPFFYIHSDPKKGSIWDRILKPIEKYYPFIWAAGVVAFGLIQIKL